MHNVMKKINIKRNLKNQFTKQKQCLKGSNNSETQLMCFSGSTGTASSSSSSSSPLSLHAVQVVVSSPTEMLYACENLAHPDSTTS